jgi:hypothetical protein
VDRAPRGGDGLGEAEPIETFTAERDQQDGADIGMRAEAFEHHVRVVVGVAAGKADDVDVVLAQRQGDFPRDVVRAFHEVGDGDDVADALAAVLAQPAAHVGHDDAPCREMLAV